MASQDPVHDFLVGRRMVDQGFEQVKGCVREILAHTVRPATVGGPYVKQVAQLQTKLLEPAQALSI
jgi:hypothetical protein